MADWMLNINNALWLIKLGLVKFLKEQFRSFWVTFGWNPRLFRQELVLQHWGETGVFRRLTAMWQLFKAGTHTYPDNVCGEWILPLQQLSSDSRRASRKHIITAAAIQRDIPHRSEMEELLLLWYLNKPKAAVFIIDAASDSVMLLFFPSILRFSSFSSSLKKKPKTQRNVLMAERSHITAQTEPHWPNTHTRTHRCWYLSLCLYFDALLLFPWRPVQTAG